MHPEPRFSDEFEPDAANANWRDLIRAKTAKEIITHVFVDRETVRKWKKGASLPRWEYIEPLATCLGIEATALGGLLIKCGTERFRRKFSV